MIRLLINKAEIPPMENKSFTPFVVDFKAKFRSQENKSKKTAIKIEYNFRLHKIKEAIIASF